MKKTSPLVIICVSVVAVICGIVTTQVTTGNVSTVYAQQATPKPGTEPVTITPQEKADLDAMYKDNEIIQLQSQNLQLRFNQRINEIRTAHNFGADVVFDGNTRVFYRTPKAAEPAKAKDEPKAAIKK